MEHQSQPNLNTNEQPVTIGDWFITIFLTAIPIIGFIMLFVWSFGGDTHPSKANWAKATLIWFAIIIGFYTMVAIAFGVFAFSDW